MRTVSVVVATRERPEAIQACLRSLRDEPAHEILVVDNGCSPPLVSTGRERVVREERPGVSNARNRGFAEATGDVVLFIDDDATARPGLVAAHAAAYEPGVLAVGGRIHFASTSARPPWLDPYLETMLTIFDRGPSPRDLVETADLPYGANLSFDRTAALDLGGFDARLSRRGGRSLHSGEDTDLLERIREVGGRIRWCPDAEVDHHVPAERLRLWWFVRRGWRQGATDVNAHRRPRDPRLALGLVKLALQPGGTEWPESGRPPLPRRLAVELIRRVRLLGAAAAVGRR